MQIAAPGAPHRIDLQLIVAARFIQGHVAPELELFAGLGNKPDSGGAPPQHYPAQTRPRLLALKITMTSRRRHKLVPLVPAPNPADLTHQYMTYRASTQKTH